MCLSTLYIASGTSAQNSVPFFAIQVKVYSVPHNSMQFVPITSFFCVVMLAVTCVTKNAYNNVSPAETENST